jgi:FkbM family methyltransferase
MMLGRVLHLLGRSTRLRKVYRLILEFFECHQSDYSRTLFRLRRLEGKHPGQRVSFLFPWGSFECVSAGLLRAQFAEIFIARQYAFRPEASQPVIVDCGANVGLSAIWFRLNYPTCHLTVYEADPDLANILIRNLERAGLNDIEVRKEAAWVRNERVAFDKTGDDKGKISPEGQVFYPAVDLSIVLPPRVDLLKLDVEGAEFAILNNLCEKGAIHRVECLISEFHVTRNKVDDALQTLENLRTSGMKLSIKADIVPWIGFAEEAAPFEVVGKNQVLMMVYGWRSAGKVA